jgi:hypothetical protein
MLKWLGGAFVVAVLLVGACGEEDDPRDRAVVESGVVREDDAQAKAETRAARRAARERRAARRARARRARARRERARIQAAVEKALAEAEEKEATAPDCDPNYSGACMDPNSSDYDCEGGSGDGPDYVGTVQVVGDDVHDLDRDGDGTACDA